MRWLLGCGSNSTLARASSCLGYATDSHPFTTTDLTNPLFLSLSLVVVTVADALDRRPEYLAAIGVGAVFFVISTVVLLVITGKRQFLWFTSLPCLGFYITSYAVEISGVIVSSANQQVDSGDLILYSMVLFQPLYNGICVAVIYFKIRSRLQNAVPAPLFIVAMVLSLIHPANITCLALFHSALDFEILQLGSSFGLAMLVRNFMMIFNSGLRLSGILTGRDPYRLLSIYTVILAITCFTMTWDLVIEMIKWRVTRTATLRTQENNDVAGEEVPTEGKNGNETVEGELPDEATQDLGQSLVKDKGPTEFGERPVDLSFLNDPGSADKVQFNHQYKTGNEGSYKHAAKRTERLLEPLLDGPEEGSLLPPGKVAPYEASYSKFFAWALLPYVLIFHIFHVGTIIGFPLARLSLWRYRLAFGGFAKSIEGRRHVQRYSFAASRGLFLFPISFGCLLGMVFFFFLLVLPILLALFVARGFVLIFRIDPSGVKGHLNSLRAAVLFVGSCIVWTFIPFLSTLPAVGKGVGGPAEDTWMSVLGRVVFAGSLQLLLPFLTLALGLKAPTFIDDPSMCPGSLKTIVYICGAAGILLLLSKVAILTKIGFDNIKRRGYTYRLVDEVIRDPFAPDLISTKVARILYMVVIRIIEACLVGCYAGIFGVQAYLWTLFQYENAGLTLGLSFSLSTLFVALPSLLASIFFRRAPNWLRLGATIFFMFFTIAGLMYVTLASDPCLSPQYPTNADEMRSFQLCPYLTLTARGENFESAEPLVLNFIAQNNICVNITDTTGITSLGFPSGSFVYDTDFSRNAGLQNLTLGLRDSGYNFLIVGNLDLETLSLPNLYSINSNSTFSVSESPNLTSLSFDTVSQIPGTLNVSANNNLASLSFKALYAIGGGLEISSNPKITALVFPTLAYVQPTGFIRLRDNAALTRVAFPNAYSANFLPQLSCPPGVNVTDITGMNFTCPTQ